MPRPATLPRSSMLMLEKATTLCDAHSGFLWTYNGERFQAAATRGLPPPFEKFVREPRVPGPDTGITRLAAGEALVHFADVAAIDSYESGDALRRASFDLGGFRTILVVPLRKDDVLLGGFTIDRQEVRPFSDKQIALVQNFAAQAVIAMENARLLTETREALEQQTATAEVLQVINSSPGDITPVFDAILEKAHSLCGATIGSLQTYDGEFFRSVAARGLPAAFVEMVRQPFRPDPDSFEERVVRGEDFVHVPDVRTLGLPDNPISRAAVGMVGLRTVLLLPLRKENALVGYIAAARSVVQPFTDREIALLQNFAAQAVIAMENARLINQTREALEQQTATAEVLGVINSSPGNLAPVFEAMLEKATRLCDAA